MNIAGILLTTGYALNILLILFILFFEERDSSHRFTWLLLVSFIPVAGFLLYLLFSGTFFTRSRRMLRATRKAYSYYEKVLDDQQRNLESLIQSGTNPAVEEYGSLIHMNLTYGKSPVTSHNSVDVFLSGEEKYQTLFADILRAKETIHLSYFIIVNDSTGRELISVLSKKAAEGVAVRLLYDHVGSIFTSSTLFRPLKKAGGMVSRFFPISLFNPFSINYRNHRKLVIIDGKIGYFGGMNIADEYANRNNARPYYWRDTHLRITGPAVQFLQKQFLVDWYTSMAEDRDMHEDIPVWKFFTQISDEENPRPAALSRSEVLRVCDVPMQIVNSGPDDPRNDEIRDAMIHMITKAKKSVWIETPYFTPDQAFFTALKIAAFSGVSVEIIVPGSWDKWYVRLAAMPYIRELLECGVKFWQYEGFIHSKMMVIDGLIATIGTTNMDTRSFSLHFELNAFFYSEDFGKTCSAIFHDDQAKSKSVPRDFFHHTPMIRRAVWNFFRLFAPLM
ncbi:cardiolipin synthase [Treponema zuelzerae]|uniref:Cardiolipin synthase n=1 Tax=Teretinema zuelzerae TaxID=156 RepID=A0AAE3EHQ4_9SPIR|nr:cardiolipin synthase [Teretinema zuelzerae]MCD1653719.1 cardiolipin synthase [Teretinema zuelzerae]